MNIKVGQWQDITEAAQKANEALKALDGVLTEVLLANLADRDVIKFISSVEARLSDARYITGALQLQSEWLGGDSSDGDNTGLREPIALQIVGHIPHAIPNTKGMSVLPKKK